MTYASGRASARNAIFFALAALFAVIGCDCDDDDPVASLTIETPMDGETVTTADDADPAAEGIQIVIVAQARGLATDEQVGLFLDSSASAGADPDATALPTADGTVRFPNVTLRPGTLMLQARARDGGVVSNVVRLTVSDDCATISFVSPALPMGDRLTLGPNDDTDGTACGEVFTTDVTVSTDAGTGRMARVFVNNIMRGTAMVQGTVARFAGVTFDNRGDDNNTLRVEVDTADGVTCGETFGAEIFVDCDGGSCMIESPTGAFLNRSDDTSDVAGFQTDVEVSAGGTPRSVRLVIDGDETGARSTLPGAGGTAVFGNVTLEEGTVRLQAVCEDDAGNVTRSGTSEFRVDITPCTVDVTTPDTNQLFNDMDDADAMTAGLQIQVSGSVMGAGCEGTRVGLCSEIDSLAFDELMGSDYSGTITLASATRQDVCAEVRDDAGNEERTMVPVRVRTDAPQLEIESPIAGTRINALGNMFGGNSYEPDATPATSICDIDFSVLCSEVDVPVQLKRDTTVLATANCDASATAGDYAGRATFGPISLGAEGTISVRAEQMSDRLTGSSEAVTLEADCSAPVLGVIAPTCGSILRPAMQDTSPDPGFQFNVRINNTNTPRPPVTLRIYPQGGDRTMPSYTATPGVEAGTVNQFADATFSGGMTVVEGEAVDAFGNVGLTPSCVVNVADLPTLDLTAPMDLAVMGPSADCDPRTGFQLQVTGTTDAPAGSALSFTAGGMMSSATVGSGGAISACIDSGEGTSVTLLVTVTDVRGQASAMRTLAIDSQPPPNAINLALDGTTPYPDRRGGQVNFVWTAVGDAGGSGVLSSYELRCRREDPYTTDSETIDSEAAWTMAILMPTSVTPASAGTAQSAQLDGFRPEEEWNCAIRGRDAGGSLTPLGTVATVAIRFLTATFSSGSTTFGFGAGAVGDLNNDTFDDFAVAEFDRVHIYYGSDTSLPTTAQVQIADVTSELFGRSITTVGDVNLDGAPDFVVGATNLADAGSAYLFYGRAPTASWPSTVSTSSCTADVCFRGPAGTSLVGISVAPVGDFDGDGTSDIAIGGSRVAAGEGRVFIVKGGSFMANQTVDLASSTSANGFQFAPPSSMTARFGQSIASMGGDINGDGRTDLLVGAPGVAAGMSGVFLVPGRAYTGTGLQPITVSAAETIATSTGRTLGQAVAATDADGDGRMDALSLRFGGTGMANFVRAFLNGPSGFSASTFVEFSGEPENSGNDSFGNTIATSRNPEMTDPNVGDLDRDGTLDAMTGSLRTYGAEEGSVCMWYGRARTAGTITYRNQADLVFRPETSVAAVGRAPTLVGDYNGDGYPDMLVCDTSTEGAYIPQCYLVY